jgi:hypothetical protein
MPFKYIFHNSGISISNNFYLSLAVLRWQSQPRPHVSAFSAGLIEIDKSLAQNDVIYELSPSPRAQFQYRDDKHLNVMTHVTDFLILNFARSWLLASIDTFLAFWRVRRFFFFVGLNSHFAPISLSNDFYVFVVALPPSTLITTIELNLSIIGVLKN